MNQIADYFVKNGYTIIFDKIDKNIIRIQADNPTEPHFYHLIYTHLNSNTTTTLVINTYNNDVVRTEQTIIKCHEEDVYEEFLEFIKN